MKLLRTLKLPGEVAYHRRVLFALEVLDAVTLERVSQGLNVVADGLRGKPIINSGGLFVWLKEDFAKLQRITIDPDVLPYQPVEIAAADVTPPFKLVELAPSANYPFATGVTGLRGTLIESQDRREPVGDAKIGLQWWRDGNPPHWQNSPAIARTGRGTGDFVSILRLASDERPIHRPRNSDLADDAERAAEKTITLRLRARRNGGIERNSIDLAISPGRIANLNPDTKKPWVFAWNELQP